MNASVLDVSLSRRAEEESYFRQHTRYLLYVPHSTILIYPGDLDYYNRVHLGREQRPPVQPMG